MSDLRRHFDSLTGDWHLEGEVMGKALVQEVEVTWVLGDAYLRIHYLPSIVTPLTDQPYEAICFIGWLPEGRPIMYLFDIFGAAFPAAGRGEPLEREGFRFRFSYPEGEFITDLIPDGPEGWRIEQSSIDKGRRVPFGHKRLRRGG
ncbi:MAG: hypothetical protein WB239_16050 [Acidimicrobiia bacterium]